MGARFGAVDGRAAIVGGVTLMLVVGVYFVGAADRPLAGFVLPSLLTAVLGGWRPTLAVGAVSMGVAVLFGVLGPLAGEALGWRLVILFAAVATGVIGAALRERQSARIADMDEV